MKDVHEGKVNENNKFLNAVIESMYPTRLKDDMTPFSPEVSWADYMADEDELKEVHFEIDLEYEKDYLKAEKERLDGTSKSDAIEKADTSSCVISNLKKPIEYDSLEENDSLNDNSVEIPTNQKKAICVRKHKQIQRSDVGEKENTKNSFDKTTAERINENYKSKLNKRSSDKQIIENLSKVLVGDFEKRTLRSKRKG